MFAIDLTVAALTVVKLPATVESTLLAKVKSVGTATIQNSGDEVIGKTAPAVSVQFVLRTTGAADIVVGTARAAKLGGLKVGATKKITAPIAFPAGTARANYTLVARVDPTNALAESDETNNERVGQTVAIVPGGTALFRDFGFADSMTFTSTNASVRNNVFTDSGTFVDANGVTGIYLYAVQAPIFNGGRQVSLTLRVSNQPQTYTGATVPNVKKFRESLGGRSAKFTTTGAGDLKFLGNPAVVVKFA